MTARERVFRARRALVATVAAATLLSAAGAALAVVGLATLADLAVGLPPAVRRAVPIGAGFAAVLAAAWRAWGARRLAEPGRVALWIEERVPELRYALVTGLDPASAGHEGALDAQAARVPFEAAVHRHLRRALAAPLLVAGGLAAVLALLPRPAVVRAASPRSGGAAVVAAPEGNALTRITVRVAPPAYTGLAPATLDDPARVVGLAGSRVSIEGRASGASVRAAAGPRAVQVGAGEGRWRATLAMPAEPVMVRLAQGARERLLLLEPVTDSAPVVALESPLRDTVLRRAAGTLPLRASFRDDVGLARGWWELVVSSGGGENFTFRTIVVGQAGFGNARTGSRTWPLRLDSLGLKPGDLVHLRAVARDGNTATGPGEAGSETRTVRIARAGEYDSVSVEPLPPPDPLEGVISQRMLILLTEALEKRRPRMARDDLLGEVRPITGDQAALRRRVGDLIFARLDELGAEGEHAHDAAPGRADLTPEELLQTAEAATDRVTNEALDFAEGESPVVAVNRPLLEAYNAMWDAGRALGIGDTRSALPHMYRALAAIQAARAAERFYLRGATRPVVVDLGKVRLVGKKDGIAPGPRSARGALDLERARRAGRLDAAIERLAVNPTAAVDSLLILRAELLGTDPAVAAPLAEAIDALRAGRDATEPLVAARRAFDDPPSARAGLPAWSGLP